MVELTIEQATAIANKLGEMPANQCYNQLSVLLHAIDRYEKSQEKQQPPIQTIKAE